jgi:hypothetical protein
MLSGAAALANTAPAAWAWLKPFQVGRGHRLDDVRRRNVRSVPAHRLELADDPVQARDLLLDAPLLLFQSVASLTERPKWTCIGNSLHLSSLSLKPFFRFGAMGCSRPIDRGPYPEGRVEVLSPGLKIELNLLKVLTL